MRPSTMVCAAAVAVALVGISGCTSNKSSTSSPTTAAAAAATTNAPATTAATVPTRKVTCVATTLATGTFTGGTDVQVGLYDVTPGAGQSGNFIVTGGKNSYNEILGSGGVPKVRVSISSGDKIQIASLSQVSFTPVTTPLVSTHTPVAIYAGTWTVGEDVGPGKYVAAPASGDSGNFIITSEDVNEILGGSGVPNVTFTVKKGDVIVVGSLSQVTLTPA
jgi:hypothetical protein